jgi:dinuclear metal center YbgI/SA1388 family protein
MTVREITGVLEELAPPVYQESYDNSGLLVGEPTNEVNKVLVCLDCLETVVDEAIEKGAEMIVAHHPIVFGGLKRLTGKTYSERVVMKALRNNIAIYAIHTNLDNVQAGVNKKIGERLGLENLHILSPMPQSLYKLVTYTPSNKTDMVMQALFTAGAGHIGNYADCSFTHEGVGSFRGLKGTNPFVGETGKRHFEKENKIEVVVPKHLKSSVVDALLKAHPYEEVAYDLYKLENTNQQFGAGMVGELATEMSEEDFLQFVKKALKTDCIRYTALLNKPVKRVAFCGGSGSFLLNDAIAAGADVFITGDFKYHQFFDADKKLVIADVGHFESEQFTIDLLADYLMEKFPTFAVLKTEVNTNPIAYI